jgi:hypothetical protein
MNILFLVTSEISLNMRSQIFFSRSLVLWGDGFVLNVCYEEGVIIGQGLKCYSTHHSMFHLMNYSNMQLFLLLDQGEGTIIL